MVRYHWRMKQNKKGEGKMRCRVEVGLLILSLAFVVSFWGGLGVGIDLGEFRIIPILEANPNRYFEYMRDAFLFCILPPAVGLAYSIIAFVRERKSPTGVLEWWLPLMVVGGFFFFLGSLWALVDIYHLFGCYTTLGKRVSRASGDCRPHFKSLSGGNGRGYSLVVCRFPLYAFTHI